MFETIKSARDTARTAPYLVAGQLFHKNVVELFADTAASSNGQWGTSARLIDVYGNRAVRVYYYFDYPGQDFVARWAMDAARDRLNLPRAGWEASEKIEILGSICDEPALRSDNGHASVHLPLVRPLSGRDPFRPKTN